MATWVTGALSNTNARTARRIDEMKNAIQEISHTKICPRHTAVAQMLKRVDGVRYRAKCRSCGRSSPEYTRKQWDQKWPQGIGCEWPKKQLPIMIFDGQDFVEKKIK